VPVSKGFATEHIERMISRIYALAVTASTVETMFNAWGQRAFLLPVSIAFVGILIIVNLGLLVSGFTTGNSKLWFRVHAWMAVVLVADWHLQVRGVWPAQQHPWVWWALGAACISAGIGYRGWFGWLLQMLIPALWVVVARTNFGGAHQVQDALADAAYLFFLSATISAIAWSLRDRARHTDSANLKALAAATANFQSIALERESIAAVSMVHTQVLAPIDEALEAETEDQRKIAAASADYAIRSMNWHLGFEDLKNPTLPLTGFIESIERTIGLRYPRVKVSSVNAEGVTVPSSVLLAMVESTLQAVDNSARHAGHDATVKVKVEGLQAGIRILISDDGNGFRVRRDSRGNLGINRSIRERSESVGIEAKVDSKPGKGCRVSLKWVAA
jgi:hypothetical protein